MRNQHQHTHATDTSAPTRRLHPGFRCECAEATGGVLSNQPELNQQVKPEQTAKADTTGCSPEQTDVLTEV